MSTTKNNYFEHLNLKLKEHPRAIPFLLIDLDRLDKNIDNLIAAVQANNKIRLVVKSLPSYDLIRHAMKRIDTNKLMVFHQPFLTHLTDKLTSSADVLLGKPMPIKTATYYYENLPNKELDFDPYTQIQWLADTEKRIQQYVQLAKKLDKKLRLNLEIDVGLHRGGFKELEQLRRGLKLLTDHSGHVSFSGFMGYDPHIVKLPRIIRTPQKSLQLSNQFYNQCKHLIKHEFPTLWHENLTFNGAGSPTFNLHTTATSPLNDIAVGSCLVKPTTFDSKSLEAYIPACFIATPVLKKFKGTTLPGLEAFTKLLSLFNRRNQQSFFIYGGYWKADYSYPNKIRQNSLFGASTNQTMLNAPNSTILDVGDFVFLRPQQSEFVFLQFGDILTIRNNELDGVMKIMTPD